MKTISATSASENAMMKSPVQKHDENVCGAYRADVSRFGKTGTRICNDRKIELFRYN
jgi:hypothetical protein